MKLIAILTSILMLVASVEAVEAQYFTEPELQWANFFLSEFFLTTLIAVSLASYIGMKVKSGLAFAGALVIFLLILTFAGIYPMWMLIVFGLIALAVIFMWVKGKKEGEE